VVNTHFHFDHCGGNYLLPNATAVVQRALMDDRPDFVAGPFQLLDGDAELVPYVRVIATPGHVPGHQSVVVETARGPVVVVGDAVYTATAYHSAEPQRQARNGEAYQRSLQRIRDLDPYLVLFAHDRRVAGRGAPTLAKRPASSVQSDRR
jgi:glyoxylase-like metal-dependent hydrolase (beta-lactamase superfamily II)